MVLAPKEVSLPTTVHVCSTALGPWCMLTLQLSPYFLEIPNDVYITDTQSILIGCSTLSQEYCKLIGLYWKIMRGTTLCQTMLNCLMGITLIMPIYS